MLQSDCHLSTCSPSPSAAAAPRRGRGPEAINVSRTVGYAILGVLALALTAGRVAGQSREIDPDGLYPAGTRLTSPLTGIAFQLPAGFRAEWDRDLGALLALSADGAFGAVWGWSEGSVDDAAGEVGARLDQQGITLEVRGEPAITPTELRAVFEAMSPDGGGVLHALIQQGPRGGVVAVAGLGAEVSEATAARFVDEVGRSLEWTQPGASVWRDQVAGAVLTWDGGASDLSTGSTTATGASSSSATISFCSPDQYAYRQSSETYVSIMGASASNTSSDEHAGGWWLIADLSGRPLLVLEATDGRTFQWTVEEAGDAFLIDGYRYRVTGQC